MRSFLRTLLRLILRIFFPRIEISGIERVPSRGPVILVVNHPNALIDPIFLLCLSPRPVSFLAKAPLFEMPVIGWFVRALGSIPVYRHQDEGSDPRKNRETFDRARSILAGGGVIALFPEGTSHDDLKLRPIKTGAARIALGAAAVGGGGATQLIIAPVGLYYTAKAVFRSGALLYFGEPISVAATRLDANGESPPDEVRDLTQRLERALGEVTLQADAHEAMSLVARAEEVFSADEPASGDHLVHQFELRRRFMAGYSALRARAPERLELISTRISRYEAELSQAGLDRRTLMPADGGVARLLAELLKGLAFCVIVLPAALVGTVVHYPAYRLVQIIATGLAKTGDDVLATIKILAGATLFPLTWIAVAVTLGILYGSPFGFMVLLVVPFTGYVAIRFFERLDEFMGGARALFLSRSSRWGLLRLAAERRAIREEILQLAAELEA